MHLDSHEICRQSTNTRIPQVYRSPIMRDQLNPVFPKFELTLKELCGGNTQSRLLIEVKDYDIGQHNDHMGYVMTNVHQMESYFRYGHTCV
jgi:hypothetical protein